MWHARGMTKKVGRAFRKIASIGKERRRLRQRRADDEVIRKAVERAVREYGPALKKMGDD